MTIKNTRPVALALLACALAPIAGASSTSGGSASTMVYCVDGDPNEGYFGTWIVSAGDVDMDGKEDMIVGAPWKKAASQVNTRGYARVISGGDGTQLFHFVGDNPGDEFGHSVAGVGDMNGDGFPDFLVGARGAGSPGNAANYAKTFSGFDGSLLYKFTGTGSYGYNVGKAGDVNADGHADVIIGAHTANPPYFDVYSGIDGSLIRQVTGNTGSFGISVGSVGDIDQDGYADVITMGGGYAYVYSGQWLALGTGQDVLYQWGIVGGGKFEADPADFNGDGFLDVVIGEPAAGGSNGRVRVFSGADGAHMVTIPSPDTVAMRQFGRHTSVADIDGDGTADIVACGIEWSLVNGVEYTTGGVYAFSGVDFSIICEVEDPGTNAGFGNTAAAINVDGYGASEIVVSELAANNYAGTVCVYSGCDTTTPPADTDPPTVTITSPADDAIIGQNYVSVAADVVDASSSEVTSTPSGLQVSLAAGGGPATGTVSALAEGSNTIAVTAEDSAGNVGGDSVTVVVDTLAPTATIISPAPGTVLGMSPAEVTLDVSDATATSVTIAGTVYTLQPGGGTIVASFAVVEGSNSITIDIVDEASNATSVTVDVVLDLSAPIVAIDSPQSGASFGPGQELVAVTATVDDLTATVVTSDPAGVSASLPAGGGVALGAVTLVEGSNAITVSATDSTAREGSGTITVVLDTTAPATELLSPETGDLASNSIDFDAEVTDVAPGTGVAQVDFLVDGAVVETLLESPFGTVVDTTTLSDGAHTFSVSATDAQGNVATDSAVVTVDNTEPGLAFTSPLDGAVVSGDFNFSIFADDATAGLTDVQVLVEGLAPTGDPSQSYATPVPSAELFGSEDSSRWSDGPIVLSVVALDAAGNETSVTITVTVDNTAPDQALVSPSDGQRVKNMMLVSAESSDPSLESITLFVDGVEIGSSTSSPISVDYDTRLILDGAAVVEAHVRDLAGNVSVSQATVTVDNMRGMLLPKTINLRARRTKGYARAVLFGPNLDLLLPTEAHQVELRVPGGNSVPAIQDWYGDNFICWSMLQIAFDRRELVNSLRAGIANGTINPGQRVPVDLVVDGRVIHKLRIRVSRWSTCW